MKLWFIPLYLLYLAGVFFFVYKIKNNWGIYLGVLLILPFAGFYFIFLHPLWLLIMIPPFCVYLVATALRIDKNITEKEQREKDKKEQEKREIIDL